jgi:chemotaxis protein MotB
MKNTIKPILIGVNSFIVLLSGCVSQGSYDTLTKERDEIAQKNRALEDKLTLAQNEKNRVTQELEAAKQRIDVTNRVIIGSYGRLVETRAKAMTEAALYEKLVNNLASEVKSKHLTIQQMKSGVILNLPEAILFDSGSSVVKTSGVTVLKKVANELTEVPFQTVVAGFSDNVPISQRLAEIFPSNWDLAAARATNVVRLLESSGVPKERLVVVSLGENQPVASNDTVEGRAQNRRIEIRLRPVVIE